MNKTVPESFQHATMAGKVHSEFNEKHLLEELRHYLPTQTPLKDFIHHNSLHAFQDLKFFEAIFRASGIFGYQVTLQLEEFRQLFKNGRIRKDVLDKILEEHKGPDQVNFWKENLLHKNYDRLDKPRIGQTRINWKTQYSFDMDNHVQPLLFRVLCSYLDQGISNWKFPVSGNGFLDSIRELEKQTFTSFFKTARIRELLLNGNCEISNLLKIIVGDEVYFESYLFDQQFSHRGWSGMVCAIEAAPHTLMDPRKISLHDLIVFELLLEMDALEYHLGNSWDALSKGLNYQPQPVFDPIPHFELNEVLTLWQLAFEWSYYDEVMAGLQAAKKNPVKKSEKKSFQAMFCIDERECSIRRHIEKIEPDCETFGTPGFFGVEFFFQPENGKFYDKLCPAPVTPKYLIKESGANEKRKHESLYSGHTHKLLAGLLSSFSLGFWSGIRMFQNLFRPEMSPAISNAFAHMNKHSKLEIENLSPEVHENGLQVGFTVEEMATRVEGLLRGIGLVQDFSTLIYVIAHGSSSANNPHHGAHDCGACSGRPGSVNARVFAFMANHEGVRSILEKKGIHIPSETRFIGGLHDTAADQIEFYDDEKLTESHSKEHNKNRHLFEQALDLNAFERSRRFASINTNRKLGKVRKAILDRSVSMFEPRPELGHGTNTTCIVGNRNLTRGLFLDRRAFLNSYDYRTDPQGNLLTGIMRPLGPVCGGINLEYYFSRVDNHKLGAGTKLPHHVMGLIGVANSSDGDLRPGLPLQMIEVHDPVRLLIIVEHYPDVVMKSIQSSPEMYEWYINEWVHLMVIDPSTGSFNYFSKGKFTVYTPLANSVHSVKDLKELITSAPEMETNQITDATRENLPVYSIH